MHKYSFLVVAIVAYLASLPTYAYSQAPMRLERQSDRVRVWIGDVRVTDFVFDDPEILRPYFASVKTGLGIQVTRNHPPVEGVDRTDHPTMHPGIWYAFGDVSGVDFWRNKGSVRHADFTLDPQVVESTVRFATRSELLDLNGEVLGYLDSRFAIRAISDADWLLRWELAIHAVDKPLSLGDQEEMGFGVRVATAIAERNGGLIRSSEGKSTAADTWGKTAEWCSYWGEIDSAKVGVTMLASPQNFRPSWWHNRDYGLMVANAFGRKAFKQGEASQVMVSVEEPLTLAYGVFVHGSSEHGSIAANEQFLKLAE